MTPEERLTYLPDWIEHRTGAIVFNRHWIDYIFFTVRTTGMLLPAKELPVLSFKEYTQLIENQKKQPIKSNYMIQDFTEPTTNAAEPLPTPVLSFGQKLVGLTFNPSGDDKVARAKKLCAELADLVHEDFTFGEKTFLKNELYSHTIGEILNAQMNAVKLLTLKY